MNSAMASLLPKQYVLPSSPWGSRIYVTLVTLVDVPAWQGAGGGHNRMLGNPQECRLHALECVRLAQTSTTPQGRDHFAKLARTWIKLAEDLERSRKFLDKIAAESETQAG